MCSSTVWCLSGGGRAQDCPGVRYHLVRGALDLVSLSSSYCWEGWPHACRRAAGFASDRNSLADWLRDRVVWETGSRRGASMGLRSRRRLERLSESVRLRVSVSGTVLGCIIGRRMCRFGESLQSIYCELTLQKASPFGMCTWLSEYEFFCTILCVNMRASETHLRGTSYLERTSSLADEQD